MSRRLVLVAVLACLLAASSPSTVAPQTLNSIWVEKSTTSGDTSTQFRITVYQEDLVIGTFNLPGDGSNGFDRLATPFPTHSQDV